MVPKLYAAFEAAAERGVAIRILQCRGASLCSDTEATQLQRKYPNQVSLRYWNATDWFDGGIMHQKLWIADKSHVYRTCLYKNLQCRGVLNAVQCNIQTCLSCRVACTTLPYRYLAVRALYSGSTIGLSRSASAECPASFRWCPSPRYIDLSWVHRAASRSTKNTGPRVG